MNSTSALRSFEGITTADALVPDPTAPTLQSSDPAGITHGAASLVDFVDGAVPTSLANQTVLGTHAALEGTSDQNGVAGTVHGVTNLGETAGLGHIGEGSNLITGVLQAPAGVLSGEIPTLDVTGDAASVGSAVEAVPVGVASDLGANPALVGSAVPSPIPLVDTAPAEGAANATILDFHDTIEGASDMNGTSGTTHGVTGLGETVGLGHIGSGSNLLTDMLNTPSDLLAGNTGPVSSLPTDAANDVTAVGTLVSGVGSDLGSGQFLSNPVGNTLTLGDALTTLPVGTLANQAAGAVVATVTMPLGGAAPVGIGGVPVLGEGIAPVADLPNDVASIGSGVGGAIAGVGSSVADGGLAGAATHPTTGSGVLGGTLPGQGVLHGVEMAGAGVLDGAGTATGTEGIIHAGSGAAGAAGTLVQDALHVPGDTLAGASTGAAPLPGDVGAASASLGSIVTASGDALAEHGAGPGGTGDLAPLTSAVDGASGLAHQLAGEAGMGATALGNDAAAATQALVPTLVADSHGLAGDAASGVASTAATVAHDVGTTAASLASTVGGGAQGAASAVPVTGLVGELASTAHQAAGAVLQTAQPLTGALAGSTPGAGHPIGMAVNGVENALSGHSGGAHDLATVSLGAQGPASGTSLDVLTANGAGEVHLFGTHSGTVGAPTPVLANVGVLPDTLHFPAPSGGGADALTGALTAATGSAGAHGFDGGTAAVAHDAGPIHVEMPVAHADPLHALAPAAHAHA